MKQLEQSIQRAEIKPDKYFITEEKKQKLHVMIFSKYKLQIHAHVKGDEVTAVHIKSETKNFKYPISPVDFRIYEAKVLQDWNISLADHTKKQINLADTNVGKMLKK